MSPVTLTAKGKRREDFAKEILDTLENGVSNFYSSAEWKSFLEYNSKFHNYSINNRILMMLQNPTATQVASMTTWNKLGRSVIAGQGALGMKILAPKICNIEEYKLDPAGKRIIGEDGKPEIEKVKKVVGFLPVSVYDISQTHGKPVQTLDLELSGSSDKKEDIISALEDITNIKFVYENIDKAYGYFNKTDRKIALKTDVSDVQTIKTAIHETAHFLLHDVDAPQELADRQTKEIQAESVAFTVCNRIGIDTGDYSFGYIGAWAANKDLNVMRQNIDIICNTADEIAGGIEKQFEKSRQKASEFISSATELSDDNEPDI